MKRITSFIPSNENQDPNEKNKKMKNETEKHTMTTKESKPTLGLNKISYDIIQILINYDKEFETFMPNFSFDLQERYYLQKRFKSKYLIQSLTVDNRNINFLNSGLHLCFFTNLRKLIVENVCFDLNFLKSCNTLTVFKLLNSYLKINAVQYKNVKRISLKSLKIEFEILVRLIDFTFPALESISINKVYFMIHNQNSYDSEYQKMCNEKILKIISKKKLKKVTIKQEGLELSWIESLINLSSLKYRSESGEFDIIINRTFTTKNRMSFLNVNNSFCKFNYNDIFRYFSFEQSFCKGRFWYPEIKLSDININKSIRKLEIPYYSADTASICNFFESLTGVVEINLRYSMLDVCSLSKIINTHKSTLRYLNLTGIILTSDFMVFLRKNLKDCKVIYNQDVELYI